MEEIKKLVEEKVPAWSWCKMCNPAVKWLLLFLMVQNHTMIISGRLRTRQCFRWKLTRAVTVFCVQEWLNFIMIDYIYFSFANMHGLKLNHSGNTLYTVSKIEDYTNQNVNPLSFCIHWPHLLKSMNSFVISDIFL